MGTKTNEIALARSNRTSTDALSASLGLDHAGARAPSGAKMIHAGARVLSATSGRAANRTFKFN